MAVIQERKDKNGKIRYRALVRLKGYPAQSATFERKTDAKKWGQDTESAIRHGRYFPIPSLFWFILQCRELTKMSAIG